MTSHTNNFIKFLGTSGARFVMIKQLRSSGGIWISACGANVLIDPGPGSLVRLNQARPKLDPTALDAIILTHQHLDHSGDANVMIEAMTEGGYKRRGALFCPQEALDESVILGYVTRFPERMEILKPLSRYTVQDFSFETSMRHVHPAETYGLKFRIGGETVAILSDTRYFPGLEDFYAVDTLILSVVFFEPRPSVDHLSLTEAKALILALKPRRAILTHFGLTMLKARPDFQARRLTKELGIPVVAARDGMVVRFSKSIDTLNDPC